MWMLIMSSTGLLTTVYNRAVVDHGLSRAVRHDLTRGSARSGRHASWTLMA